MIRIGFRVPPLPRSRATRLPLRLLDPELSRLPRKARVDQSLGHGFGRGCRASHGIRRVDFDELRKMSRARRSARFVKRCSRKRPE